MIESRRETLANGLRVIFIPMPTFHSAIAVVYVRMGPRFETVEENGLSHFAEHVLFKGTERHPDPDAISCEIDAIGAELNGATMPEYTELLVSCHSRHFLRGLALLSEVVLCPRFDGEHVDLERRVVLEEMGQYRDIVGDDYSIDELSYELMWPRQAHAFSCLGPEQNVLRFTRDQVEAHYRRFLKGRNTVVCVAGSFDEDAVGALIAERFGSLPAGDMADAPPLRDEQAGAQCLFRRARTRMSYLKLCHKACSYHDPQLYPVLILSDVLGGGVTSRLFARLRERDGLVYDISSNTTLFSDCGWLDITRPSRTAWPARWRSSRTALPTWPTGSASARSSSPPSASRRPPRRPSVSSTLPASRSAPPRTTCSSPPGAASSLSAPAPGASGDASAGCWRDRMSGGWMNGWVDEWTRGEGDGS